MSTKWNSGDRIMVYYAESGTTDYTKLNRGRLDCTDPEKGIFEGDLPATFTEDKTYDWYVFYPFNSNIKVTQTNGITIGCSNTGSQAQNGNDSMAHIAGTSFPLYGSVKDVPYNEYPRINMKNVASLIEYKVTNTLDKDVSITGLDIETSENIVGTWYVDYSGEEPKVTKFQEMVSKTAILKVTNASALKKGESACYYVGIAPTTIGMFNPISVVAHISDGSNTADQTFAYMPESDIVFNAGKIKTIELSITQIF